jgi:hypothetical protein
MVDITAREKKDRGFPVSTFFYVVLPHTSIMSSMLTLEVLPSSLAVSALTVYMAGRYVTSVCGENKTCTDVLSKSNMIAVVSCICAALLFLLILFGVVQTTGRMYSGMYGGGMWGV